MGARGAEDYETIGLVLYDKGGGGGGGSAPGTVGRGRNPQFGRIRDFIN